MISHSPPIFSHSPPVSFLSEFMSNNHRQGLNYNEEHNRASRYCRPQVITLASKSMVNNATAAVSSRNGGGNGLTQQQQQRFNTITSFANALAPSPRNNFQRMVSAPTLPILPKSCLRRKSCLHKTLQRMDNDATITANSTATTKTTPTPTTKATTVTSAATKTSDCECSIQCRSRKKVCFADDEGLSLTEVRVMSEPSNVPPYWSMKFLEQITQGLVSPQPADQWTVDFKQPASDYLSFRQKIEQDFVSLENVIVKDEESIVVGTVKVKNISFEKEVIVRVTWDNWKSQQDIFCTFARAYGPGTCAHVVFDTFSFKITLPPSSKCLEFCICFRAKDAEHWDNNNGKNYTITKRSPFYYNALTPYDNNNSLSRNNCHNKVMSTLSEALERNNNKEQCRNYNNNWQQEPSPYW